MSRETKTITINVIDAKAENTFAALGLNDTEDSIKAFSEKLAGITSNILYGMTGKNPDFNRNDALKQVQDNLSYEECVLLATAHLEDRAAFMTAMEMAKIGSGEEIAEEEKSE